MKHLGPHGNSSIDVEGVASNVVTGRVKGKESDHTGNLFWLSKSLEWNSSSDSFLQVVVGEKES